VTDKRAAFRAGAMDLLPIVPAVLAWGLVTGVAMVQSGLDLPKAYGMSVLTFAGSAQLAILPLLVGHARPWIIVLTALMVNMRFVIYSAALKGDLAALPTGRRVLYSYLIGDMPFVIFMRNRDQYPMPLRPVYFLGMGLANLAVWHAGSFAGLIAAGRIPAEWNLDFAGMLALIALLVPLLQIAESRRDVIDDVGTFYSDLLDRRGAVVLSAMGELPDDRQKLVCRLADEDDLRLNGPKRDRVIAFLRGARGTAAADRWLDP